MQDADNLSCRLLRGILSIILVDGTYITQQKYSDARHHAKNLHGNHHYVLKLEKSGICLSFLFLIDQPCGLLWLDFQAPNHPRWPLQRNNFMNGARKPVSSR